jgi:hypothetical protein
MGFRLSAITAGRLSFVAMLILGPVIAPGMMAGPGLPGVCGPVGYRRAAAALGGCASLGESLWPRATRR